jgi:ATP synthase protein I
MTTTERPRTGQPRGTTPRVLLVASACVALAVGVAVVIGATSSGATAAGGALVGGGLALLFLTFGSVTVYAATSLAPQSSMLVALMTFLLQVVLVAAVFYALDASGVVGDQLSGPWVAGGVITAAVSWILAQLVASARARVPVYDIDLPGTATSRDEAREVGAR